MPAEFVDVYDDTLQVIGSMERALAHRVGALHKTMQCWFVDAMHAYFQIRGKDVGFPGLLDVTVGGHVSSDESEGAAIAREAREEVGVNVERMCLSHVGRNSFTYRHGEANVREFSEVFMVMAEDGFDTFSPDPTELSGIAAVPFIEGRRLLEGVIPYLNVMALTANSAGSEMRNFRITCGSFIPGMQRYFVNVLRLSESFSKGERSIGL